MANSNSSLNDLDIRDCWNSIGVWRSGEQRCEKLDEFLHCYNCEVYSNAGRALLNRPSPVGYGDEWTEILAAEKATKKLNLHSAVVFRLGAEWLALPVNIINEITLLRNIYDIPHNKNRNIRGMVNIRGELIICMSLGNLLGVEKPDEGLFDEHHSINRLIMIKENSGQVVFPVSEIDGIAHYDPLKIKNAPDTIRNSKLHFIDGITTVKNKNIGCINHDSLIAKIAANLK